MNDDKGEIVTTSIEAKANQKDIQGIDFLLENKYYSKSHYRYRRTLRRSCEFDCNIYTGSEYIKPKPDLCAFKFIRNNRICTPDISHFQLRNGLKALSDHSLLYCEKLKIHKYDRVFNTTENSRKKSFFGKQTCIKSFVSERSLVSGIDTLIDPSIGQILSIGTLRGELSLLDLKNGDVLFHQILDEDDDEDNYVNGVQILKPQRNYSTAFTLVSSNDSKCRIYSIEGNRNDHSVKLYHTIEFTEPINFGKMNLVDQSLVVLVGDFKEVLLYDLRSGKFCGKLEGHCDFNFSISFNPRFPKFQFAVASQDHSCGVFDIRMKKIVSRVVTTMDHVRAVEYSPNGEFLSLLEAVDYIHVYDAIKGYKREQIIDLFGSLSGMSFSPGNSNSFFVGVADRNFNSLVEFSRVKHGKENNIDNIIL